VAHHYAEIGGKSPLLEFTMRQRAALEAELSADFDARVVVAMRYWRPFTEEAVREMERHAPDELVLLPLYPQYSKTTTGSSFNEWRRRFHPNGWNPHVHFVEDFHQDEGYLDSVVEAVDRSMAEFTPGRPEACATDVDVVFSAHSVPVAVIESGDPYQEQIERTSALVWQRGGWRGRMTVCYQSKVGASKWLQPSVHQTLQRLASEGRRNVLMVPISFVSDHVETLHELAIEHRDLAHSLGITDYRMVPGLNDSPSFIRALAGLVRARVGSVRGGCA
jgi:ferrochelatase